MRFLTASFFLLFAATVLAHADSVTVTVTDPSKPTPDRPYGSTLAPFAFEANITDPRINAENIDLFTNAKNSYKDNPRIQNVFVAVQRLVGEKWADCEFILFETGKAGGQNETSIFLQIIMPFPHKIRTKRIEEAFSKTSKGTFIPASDRLAFFDMYEQFESQPGKYRLSVSYNGPGGKFSSTQYPFEITDKGNLYLKVLEAIKDNG